MSGDSYSNRFAMKQKTFTTNLGEQRVWRTLNQHLISFLIPARTGKRFPRLVKVVVCCTCNSVFSFTLDQLGFGVHVYEAFSSDVYASILLFHEKLAECLRKPGMVSNSCL